MSRIAWVLGVVLLIGGCWWLYNHNKNKDMLGSGLVVSREPSPDDPGSSSTPEPAPPSPVAPTSALAAQPAAPAAPAATVKPSAALPSADTLSADPPAGMAFGGSGKYQWYRQGNITWRIDTHRGTTCIAFATMEEWQKRTVYTHGCGNA